MIATASTEELAATTPEALRLETQKRLTRPNLFRAYVYMSTAVAGIALLAEPPFGLFLAVALTGAGFYVRDKVNDWRTTRIIYDLDNEDVVLRAFLANAVGEALSKASALWHIHHAVATSDGRRNAGASTLIRRTPTPVASDTLPGIELNVEPRSVPVGPQKLLFLPDRLLVWDGRLLAAMPYESLTVDARPTRFIEEGRVPRDARQVGTTWRFVRNDGGPDLRFNNNAQLPVLEYGELELTSQSGMRIILQTSTVSAAIEASTAISRLAHPVQAEQPRTSAEALVSRTLAPASPPTRPQRTPAPASVASVPSAPIEVPVEVEELTQEVMAYSVATLLRYMATADRRLDQIEVEYARKVLAELSPDADRLVDSFRSLPSDVLAVDDALQALRKADAERREWVVRALHGMSLADGKATPKELERLDEIRYELLPEMAS